MSTSVATLAADDVPRGAAALGVDDDADDDEDEVCDDPVDVAAWPPVSTAAIANLLSEELDGAEAELLAANVTLLAGEMDGTEDPVP